MKLIYLTSFGLPTEWAHGIQVMKMCEAFARLGHEVELVAPRRRNEIKEDPFVYYDTEKNFKIKKLFCLDLAPGDPAAFYFLLRTISFLCWSKIYLLFKRYDIFYTRENLAGLFFRKIFLEIHQLSSSPAGWQIRAWRHVRKLVVLTKFIKEDIIDFGVPGEKIIIAPDGVDLEKFNINTAKEEIRKKLGLPLGKKIVMYAGSFYLHDWKGVDVLLESVKYFDKDWVLVLVGGEPKEIGDIGEKYDSSNIILAGRQPYQKIPLYLKAADVLVLPNKKGESISEKYTSPLKLFEYMAVGVPIVASDLPSIKEVMNEKNCLFFEANNPRDLAEKIKNLFVSEKSAVQIAAQALLDVQNYTWDKRAKNIMNFIN